MKKIFFFFLLFESFSCHYMPTGPAKTELNKEFDLKYGDKAVIGDEGFYITFKDVTDDSRCPLGYECVWAGNGGVLLIIEKKTYRRMVDTVNTTLDPHSLDYLDYKITLRSLKPYPVADSIIMKKDYIITLLVEKQAL